MSREPGAIVLRHHLLTRTLTFLAADPPRRSCFVAWDHEAPGGLSVDAEGPADALADRIDAELLLRAMRGVTKIPVTGARIDMAEAVDLLGALAHDDPASDSARAWAGIVRTALSLIADGKVLPWVSPDGWDSWRVDPLTAWDHERVAALAEALPAEAHATPVEGRGRMSDPVFAARALCDAVADAMIRTPAAHRIGPLRLFADPAPTRVPHLRPWVQDIAAAHCSTARLVLHMVPPATAESDRPDESDQDDEARSAAADALDRWLVDEGFAPADADVDSAAEADTSAGSWTIRFQLQSRADPSLIVDAADYWESPVEVLDRFGVQAETVLLAGLRTVGRLVEPLAGVLDDLAPTQAVIAGADLDALLDALDELEAEDIEVRWPSELLAPAIQQRLVVSAGSPPSGLASVLQLESLLDVNWEYLLDDTPLTPDELKVLASAKRSVVSLRGRWVRLDPATLDKLRQPPPELGMSEAIAVAMGAEIEIDGIPAEELFGVRATGSFDEWMQRVRDLQGDREQPEPAALQAELRGYQRRGLAWMADLANLGLGGCLADDMGLGKTIQVLALHALRAEADDTRGPMLVVCPTSLLRNWQREAARFLPDTPTRIFHGSSRHLDDLADDEIVITSYGVVRSDAETLDGVEWQLVVADEAQHAKNPRSRTARALRDITSGVRLALTGTPVENKLSELWSIYDWAVPGLLGRHEAFRRRTSLPIERDGDPVATNKLRVLLAPFLLRRHKTDPGIAPELPDKLERDVFVPLSSEQVTLYKAVVDSTLPEVTAAEGIERRGLVLKLLTSLKQITNHPAQFLKEAGPLPGRSGKLDALEDLLATIRDNGETALVFSQYVAMGRLLVDHLTGAGHRVDLLHGGLGVSARQELVDQVQGGDLDVLVLSLKAGGTGLNLTRATHVVHFDRWWNPAVEDQATDRAYRIGQDRTVTVHRIMTQGTIEDRVATLLETKRALAASVTGGGESWIGDLSDDDLAELITLDDSGSSGVEGSNNPGSNNPGSDCRGSGSSGSDGPGSESSGSDGPGSGSSGSEAA